MCKEGETELVERWRKEELMNLSGNEKNFILSNSPFSPFLLFGFINKTKIFK